MIRIMEGLILYRDTWPGGPVAFFADVSQWTFVYKNYVYTAQTLLGDGVIVSLFFPREERRPLSVFDSSTAVMQCGNLNLS